MTSPTAPDIQKAKYGHKLLVGLFLALGLAAALLSLFGHRGFYQVYRLRQETLHLEQETARLAAENDRLARTIDRLQHDPEFIQDLIRRELNFVKKNELIFQLPPEGPESSAGAPLAVHAGSAPPPRTGAGQERQEPPASGKARGKEKKKSNRPKGE